MPQCRRGVAQIFNLLVEFPQDPTENEFVREQMRRNQKRIWIFFLVLVTAQAIADAITHSHVETTLGMLAALAVYEIFRYSN
jgi:hypothetical protein